MEEIEQIDKEEIIYLDEELPEIEYYELLTFEELVEINPDFIALASKEIYSELYEIFKNANKSNNFLDLFYSITDKKEIDTTNYVLISQAIKKTYYEDDELGHTGLLDFINSFKKINRIADIKLAEEEKNKLFFAIEYLEKSKNVRFKPYYRTKIRINNDTADYILNPYNNTNLPISDIYYEIPKSIHCEKLSDKILAHLNNRKILKKIETTTDISVDFKNCKPKIEEILDELDIDDISNYETMDYELLTNILEKYDYKFDKIDRKDLDIIKKILDKAINIKEDNYKFKTVRIKGIDYINNKTNFYNKSINIFKLLKFTDDMNNEHFSIISKLEDLKANLDESELLYNNISDIINAIHNKDIDIDVIVDNLRNIVELQRITNAVNNIKDYSNNDLDKIEELFNIEKDKFNKINHENPMYYGNVLKFINISKELSEIKVANNIKDYNYVKNVNEYYYDHDNKDDIYDIKDLDLNLYEYNETIFDKFIETDKYIYALGFKEYMKIILPILNKIEENSKLTLNYESIVNKLYTEFSYLPTKYHELKKKINDIDNTISDKIIEDISKINYTKIIKNSEIIKQIISSDVLLTEKLLDVILNVNLNYLDVVKTVFFNSISIWILEIQSDIINNVHIHNYNYNYIHLWDDYGFPINKSKKVGVTIYLCDIINSVFQDIEEYEIYNIDLKIIKVISDLIDNKYNDILKKLIIESENAKINTINKNKGKQYQLELVDNLNKFKTTKTYEMKNKMLENYVKALIYMPGINYNRIHKYLLGCCLQQLNKDFASYNDLKDKRKDLIAAKTYFSKSKQTIKKNYYYLPVKNINEEIENVENELYNLEHNIYEKKEDITYDSWFKKQKDEKIFISENYENILSNGSGEYIKIIKNNFKRYFETIGNNKSNLSKYLTENIAKVNFKQINNNVIKILSENYYGDEEKDEILYKSIEYCNYLNSKYKELDNIYDINNLTDITRAKCYISVKILILPFNTEQVLGEKLQLIFDTNQDNILKYKKIGKQIHDKLSKTLQLSFMPTFEENQDFINKMREEFKNKRLELYDKLNEEQRKVFNELSKIGVKIENAIDNAEIKLNEEQPEYDGENEFIMNGNNDDHNYDDLDNDDYGHIYDE
jgi:hypothetical protein